jgi:hypothetical protein
MEISLVEWKEIMEVPQVNDAWGLTTEAPAEFAELIYGVKFYFISGSPGYDGDLYLIQPDTLNGNPPWVLTRQNGKLRLVL